MKPLLLYTLAAGAMISMPAAAQNHPLTPRNGEVTIINGPQNVADSTGTTVVNVYEIFVNNAPKTFVKSGAPRFAIRGRDGKFYLGIGGMAKATLSYDWGNPIRNGYDFTTSAIPMHQAKGNGGLVQFNAQSSGLYVNFVALPGNPNQIGVYADFNLTGGTSYGFDLQYAYVNYRGITAGYNYSLFSDMAAAPPSIDNEGPAGFTAIPKGVLDYTRTLNKHWAVGIGVETPIASATTNDHTYMVNQRVPDIPAYVQYGWGNGEGRIRLSAIMRNLQYRDCVADRNRDIVGWGVQLSGTWTPLPAITAYYQATYGQGLTSYFQDLYEGGLDLVPDAAKAGRLKAVEAWGGYIGLQYNLARNVYATTTYSHVRNYADPYSGGTTPWGEQYKYAQYALANVIWQITPEVSTGLEYIYGRRVNHDGLSRHDNRIQTMLKVTF